MNISEKSANKIAIYLKNGGRIGNAKFFSVSFCYENGMFKKIGDDMHEKERFESSYSYEGFIKEIQNYDVHEFVGLKEII